ncbi:hypothetical protein F5Y11DRAFT_362087 [Daldinia sp. FL1419]|nr:hypothetical protein F5Y11DRAFT_362087 [Daldinia sp. FL1419]
MALVSSVIVSLRIYIQRSGMSFWWDDGLMLVALIIYIGNISMACKSVQYGLEVLDANVPWYMQFEGNKFVFIWSLINGTSLVMVKFSICLTMLHLGEPTRYIRFAIYILLLASFASFLIGFVGLLTQCNPIEASWHKKLVMEGRATCKGVRILLRIVYAHAVMTILTDVACTILPTVILRGTRFKLKRLLISLILVFGFLASGCNIVRTSYVRQYDDEDIHFWTLRYVLWSNIETAIGLIAGSLPTLQRRLSSYPWKHRSITLPKARAPTPVHSKPVKPQSNQDLGNPFDTGCNITTISSNRRSRDWHRMEGTFDLHGIRADCTFEITRSEAPTKLAGMRV